VNDHDEPEVRDWAYIESALKCVFTDARVASLDIQQHEWEVRTFLKLALDDLKPERTVELGSYKGWMAALLSRITSNQTISVDVTDYGTAEAWPYGDGVTFLVEDATLPDTVTKVMATLGGPIDLLFIDDGHYYEQITKEYELWRPHVRPGGWIVFHDINPLANIGPHGIQPDCIQVTRFWNELTGTKLEIIATEEHAKWKGVLPNGGIGILKV
jgi:predicted O-methyltransferase YrrM